MDWKKVPYYIPGVGLATHTIKEYKTRKGRNPWYNLKESKDRKALRLYAIEIGYFALALSWKVWLGNGIATGEWNPLKYFDSKPKTEQVEDLSKKDKKLKKLNNLEKNLNYDKLFIK
jgi:hypothetical protein